MTNLQPVIHDGRLAAIVIAGQAIIDDTLPSDARRQVHAMCLCALEIQDGQCSGPYTGSDALNYARQACGALGP